MTRHSAYRRTPKSLLWMTTVCVLAVPATSHAGSFIRHELESVAIAANTLGISSRLYVTVHLPDDYDKGNARYPVIFFIPGFTGEIESYKNGLDDAIRAKHLSPAITVLIEHQEIVFLNSPEFGRWEDFLIKELIPFVDQNYRTVSNTRGRALMGASTGGLAALHVAVRHPNIWGAIGLIDGSAYYAGFYELHAETPGQIPKALEGDFNTVLDAWRKMPASLTGYAGANSLTKMLIQLGLAISPNPAAPLRFDPPIDKNGNPVAEVREKWRSFSLFDPSTIARERASLMSFSTIALIVPELNGATTNAYQNLYWVDLMTAAGIPVTRIDWPGGHGAFRPQRLVALEAEILKGLTR